MQDNSSPSARRSHCPVWSKFIRAVAFDMDGLMVNTEELYTQVGETILSRRGRTFTRELKNAIMGLPGPLAYQAIIETENLDTTPEILERESNEIFAELLPHRLRPLAGLLDLLDVLEARNTPMCVATSSSRRFAIDVLSGIDVLNRMQFIVTAEDVQHGKPAPDIYLAAAKQLQVLPDELLVLEDSHHGTRAGIASGACTIAVPGDHSLDHDFAGVFYVASSLADPFILNLLSQR